jgi:PBP1b-binding outer membrane lipoprotein LpoB
MKKTKVLLIFLGAALLLCGCGATSSGVVKVEQDTYTVNVSSDSSPSEAKKKAYSDANEKCAGTGKEMMVVKEKLANDIRLYVIDLVFKCVSKDMPEAQK